MNSLLTIWRGLSLLHRLGLGLGVALALLGAWKLFWWQHDRGVIADHEAGVTKAVTQASAAASEAASTAASQTITQAEKENADAREAAARNPDDPLRAGLGRLRCAQGAPCPASR